MPTPTVISHWRDSGRIPRFFGIDARSTLPLLLFLIHIKLWTFTLALVVSLFFGIIEKYGFSAMVFARIIMNALAGPRKVARPWWREDKKM